MIFAEVASRVGLLGKVNLPGESAREREREGRSRRRADRRAAQDRGKRKTNRAEIRGARGAAGGTE